MKQNFFRVRGRFFDMVEFTRRICRSLCEVKRYDKEYVVHSWSVQSVLDPLVADTYTE